MNFVPYNLFCSTVLFNQSIREMRQSLMKLAMSIMMMMMMIITITVLKDKGHCLIPYQLRILQTGSIAGQVSLPVL